MKKEKNTKHKAYKKQIAKLTMPIISLNKWIEYSKSKAI